MTGMRTSPSETLLPARRSDDAEMWCDRCGRRHGVVWFVDSDLWNAVMRDGDKGNPDEYSFCCPECFILLAQERGLVDATAWEIVPQIRETA